MLKQILDRIARTGDTALEFVRSRSRRGKLALGPETDKRRADSSPSPTRRSAGIPQKGEAAHPETAVEHPEEAHGFRGGGIWREIAGDDERAFADAIDASVFTDIDEIFEPNPKLAGDLALVRFCARVEAGTTDGRHDA